MSGAIENQRDFKHEFYTAGDGVGVVITLDNEEVLRVCIDYEEEEVDIYPDGETDFEGAIHYTFKGEYKDAQLRWHGRIIDANVDIE